MIPDARRFGFTWEFYYSTIHPEYGEIEWRTDSDDGRFIVIHTGEPTFGLLEFGGRGPAVWDYEHGVYDSPLEAMYAARKITTARHEDWKRMDKEYERAYRE